MTAAPDADGTERLRREGMRLREVHAELVGRLRDVHAVAIRLHTTAERVHRSVRLCEESHHAGEDLVAGLRRRADEDRPAVT